MEIEAKDNGKFPNTASQNYTIQVLDKNDNRVTFPGSKTYRFRMSEGLPIDTVVQVCKKKKTHLIELCDAALVSLGNGHQISRFPTILRESE